MRDIARLEKVKNKPDPQNPQERGGRGERLRRDIQKGRNYSIYETNDQLKAVIDLIASGHFSSGDSGVFKPLVDSLLYHDEYLVFADYQSYIDCQDRVSETYRDRDGWTRMSILNTARMGKFSSDRTIRQYCDEIWKVTPIPVSLEDPEDEE